VSGQVTRLWVVYGGVVKRIVGSYVGKASGSRYSTFWKVENRMAWGLLVDVVAEEALVTLDLVRMLERMMHRAFRLGSAFSHALCE